jgi:uncharacterized protein YktA (UPF0223 family)
METPILGDSDGEKTLGDMLEAEETYDDFSTDDTVMLIQSYINSNKIIEAIILDNIAFNDVQKHFKKVVKTQDANGETMRYTEYSSEFWPYKLVQIVSKLPASYKNTFMKRYNISEDKLTTVLDALSKVNNQKLYKYLRLCIEDLKVTYAM